MMLILISIDVQYLQNIIFSIVENNFPLDSHQLIKYSPTKRILPIPILEMGLPKMACIGDTKNCLKWGWL